MKKLEQILCVSLILGLSTFWIISSWYINDDLYVLKSELEFEQGVQSEIYLYYFTWALIYLVSAALVWFSLKKVSPIPRYDFTVWISIASLLALFYLTNRGHSWCILSIYGIPALGINYIIKGFRKTHFKGLKLMNKVIFTLFIIAGAIGEFQAYQWSSFENEKYEIDVCCYTIPTLLDWQVECDLEVFHKELETSCETRFKPFDGPFFSILENSNQIIVEDEHIDYRMNFCFDMNRGQVIELGYSTLDTIEYVKFATHGPEGFLDTHE